MISACHLNVKARGTHEASSLTGTPTNFKQRPGFDSPRESHVHFLLIGSIGLLLFILERRRREIKSRLTDKFDCGSWIAQMRGLCRGADLGECVDWNRSEGRVYRQGCAIASHSTVTASALNYRFGVQFPKSESRAFFADWLDWFTSLPTSEARRSLFRTLIPPLLHLTHATQASSGSPQDD